MYINRPKNPNPSFFSYIEKREICPILQGLCGDFWGTTGHPWVVRDVFPVSEMKFETILEHFESFFWSHLLKIDPKKSKHKLFWSSGGRRGSNHQPFQYCDCEFWLDCASKSFGNALKLFLLTFIGILNVPEQFQDRGRRVRSLNNSCRIGQISLFKSMDFSAFFPKTTLI